MVDRLFSFDDLRKSQEQLKDPNPKEIVHLKTKLIDLLEIDVPSIEQ